MRALRGIQREPRLNALGMSPVVFWGVGTKDQCEVTRDGGSGPREKNTITRTEFSQLRLPNRYGGTKSCRWNSELYHRIW